jgi:hypothetical protein
VEMRACSVPDPGHMFFTSKFSCLFCCTLQPHDWNWNWDSTMVGDH